MSASIRHDSPYIYVHSQTCLGKCMCVCMYICMHIWRHTSISLYVCITLVCMYYCTHVHVSAPIHIYCMSIYVGVPVCIYVYQISTPISVNIYDMSLNIYGCHIANIIHTAIMIYRHIDPTFLHICTRTQPTAAYT